MIRRLLFLCGTAALLLTGCARGAAPQPLLTAPAAAATPLSAPAVVASPAAALPTPSATPLPALPAPSPTPLPSPTVSPTPAPVGEAILATSDGGHPIAARRVGTGPLQLVVLAGLGGAADAAGGQLVAAVADLLAADPALVPPAVTLWFMPQVNPDGVAAGTRVTGAGIDLRRHSDVAFDGCSTTAWRAGPEAGPYPFADAAFSAVARFAADAAVAVVVEDSGLPAVVGDACRQHPPAEQLAQILGRALNLPVATESSRDGHLVDFLAGEGVAAASLQLPAGGVSADALLSALLAVAAGVDTIAGADAAARGADFTWLTSANSGVWTYGAGALVNPLAVAVLGETLYLLDGGRVLAQPLDGGAPPAVVLQPGDDVAGVRVLEPLDLAVDGETLLVLERAGDVYRLNAAGAWEIDRYDRPVRDISSHYFVALDSDGGQRTLLESSYQFVQRYDGTGDGLAWLLEEGQQVDLAQLGETTILLSQEGTGPAGGLTFFRGGGQVSGAGSNFSIWRPRQVAAGGGRLVAVDQAGSRLLLLDPARGSLQGVARFPDRSRMHAVWVDEQRLIIAGRDAVYFVGDPQRRAHFEAAPRRPTPALDQPDLLWSWRGMSMPAPGSRLPDRDNRMPGSPRHYRLGIHAGLDLYWQPGTPLVAPADGEVIRADRDYEPPQPADFVVWREQVYALGYTSPEAADFYRGRQVWIRHDNGLVSRYAHLSLIYGDIVVGARVAQGDPVGEVGNSGSPASLQGPAEDAHLHIEFWYGAQYLGQFMRPIETREWLLRLLTY